MKHVLSEARGGTLPVALIVVLTLALLSLAGGCGKKSTGRESAYSGTVKASGSTTVLPIALEAATEFMDANPAVNVQVQGGGSSAGITQLKEGVVQIANSSRDLQPGENEGNLVDFKIAFDIIGMVVNPSVPVSDLSSGQVEDIFTGSITNWKEVSGSDAEIVVVVRDLASGTREMFDQKALGSTKERPVYSVASAIECSSNGIVRETVATTPNSIGYISYGYINLKVKPVKYNGVPPDIPNAESGRYPMARYLHMFTKGRPAGAVKGYTDFVLSDKFQEDVVSVEYIPIRNVHKTQ